MYIKQIQIHCDLSEIKLTVTNCVSALNGVCNCDTKLTYVTHNKTITHVNGMWRSQTFVQALIMVSAKTLFPFSISMTSFSASVRQKCSFD